MTGNRESGPTPLGEGATMAEGAGTIVARAKTTTEERARGYPSDAALGPRENLDLKVGGRLLEN